MGPRFNGVEDNDHDVECEQGASASMGPRFNGVEDSRNCGQKTASCSQASMGPRFNGVEDPPASANSTARGRASMGPRFNGVEDATTFGDGLLAASGFNGATL